MTNSNCYIKKMVADADDFLELDTAAKMFPLAFCEEHRSLVRLSVVMNETVDHNSLQVALDRLIGRFPSFCVRLVHDSYHYYFEKLHTAPDIIKDSQNESFSMTFEELNKCAFKIFYVQNRIILEYFHAVADGIGGSIFLKSLIAEYLLIRYDVSNRCISDKVTIEELSEKNSSSDAYQDIVSSSGRLVQSSNSYLIEGSKDDKLHISEFSFKTDKVLALASFHGVTLTALLTSVLAAALFDLQQHSKKRQTICLSIPVDLRRRFNRNTLRNFSVPISIYAKSFGKTSDFGELCQSFQDQLRTNSTKEKLSSLVTSYVKLGKLGGNSFFPLSLKKWLVQLFFSIAKGRNCMTFSNLGVWQIPNAMKPYVKQFSMSLSTKPHTPYSCGVVSAGNVLTVTFTRSIKEPLLEKRFLNMLKKVSPNSNDDWGAVYE